MPEFHFPGMEHERWLPGGKGLAVTEFRSGEVNGIALNGMATMPEMEPDLIGPAGFWSCYNKGGTIGVPTYNLEMSRCGEAVISIDQAGSSD